MKAGSFFWVVCGVLEAATIREDFQSDPAVRGWRAFGDAALFEWNPAGNLVVRWDSSRTNSYYYKPLGTVLAKNDDFSLSFELLLDAIAVGVDPARPFTFELAVGLINFRDATSTNFIRGTGSTSPNLVELDYFPDSGFGATLSPIIVSSNNQFVPSFTFPVEFTPGDLFQIEMAYSAEGHRLSTMLKKNGEATVPIKNVELGSNFTDFRVDTFAISSYSHQEAGGSILARGSIDNITVNVPDAPASELTGGFHQSVWQVSFTGPGTWLFTLERTEDWIHWRAVSATVAGTGTKQVLQDDLPAAVPQSFYRLRMERP